MTTPQTSPFFLKVRAISFSILVLVALLSITFLAVVAFMMWDILGLAQKNFILVMLLSHSVTAIVLLILLIMPFRPWLDGARVMFVLFCELGTAAAYSISYSGLVCNPSEGGRQCKIITQDVLIVSWIVPFLLVLYVFGLGVLVWKQSSYVPVSTFATSISSILSDEEKRSNDQWKPLALFVTRPKETKHSSQTSSFYNSSLVDPRSSNAPTLDLRLDTTTLLPSPFGSPPTTVARQPVLPQPGVLEAQSSTAHYGGAPAHNTYATYYGSISNPAASGMDVSRNFFSQTTTFQPDWSQHQFNSSNTQTQALKPISGPIQSYHLPSAQQPTNYYYSSPKQVMSRPGVGVYPKRTSSSAGVVDARTGFGLERGRMMAPVLVR